MRHDQRWYYRVERDGTNLTRQELLKSDLKRLNGRHNTIDGKLVVKIISYLHPSSSCARTQPLGLLLLVVKGKASTRTLAGWSGDSVARQTHMNPRWRQQVVVAATVRIARSSWRHHAARGTWPVRWSGAVVTQHQRSRGEVAGDQPTRARAGLAGNTNKEAGHGAAHRKPETRKMD
jgi:hypothetical protein